MSRKYAIFFKQKDGNLQINVELPTNFTVDDCL